ncbi:toll/interleukin-1 receptor domain-containing protein [Phenylobacterium sp.]|uniref:toll/interleukin-1 receptor domain-containing protein n=1 Tax=Phenylobacterium sp. TaxID=1871053 RepID=UPI0025FA5F63|nr:toll/interleukin-1 receptor domain-containing protein [Phenylobacterium sp.]
MPNSLRYSAFISYSSVDTAFAARLHRDLEAYRLPRRLAQLAHPGQLRRGRLKPLFHDTWDLNAAHDLPAALREAIAQSESLIVVCSPAAATSDWVGREIELFRALHGDGRIRAALIEGDMATSFPPALLGGQGGPVMEPLAADFRRGASARKLGTLKLVAALAGVELDELIQRDAQRRTRRVVALAGASVAAMAVVSVLAVAAVTAREAARLQQARTEGLNEVMLTDVRSRLKRTGRLDLLSTVNEAVLNYYRDQNDLSDSAQEQRARLLQAMGEDDEKRGNLETAAARFAEARRITVALLAASPQDPKRIFGQAQSEYYLGFIAWQRGDGVAARRGFEAYAALAQQLVRKDPSNIDWLMETAYAESNLGMLALRQAGDAPTAERHFTTALSTLQAAANSKPRDVDRQLEVADGYAWLADTERVRGDLAGVAANRTAQRRIIDALLAADPLNVAARTAMLSNELAMARLDAARGQYGAAIARLDRGRADAVAVMKSAPGNAEVASQARAFELFKVRTLLAGPAERRPSPRALAKVLGPCEPRAGGTSDHEIADFCTVLHARILALQGDRRGASRALAMLAISPKGDAYSARWGLNLADEARLAGQSTAQASR